jgi:hypothetical protein
MDGVGFTARTDGKIKPNHVSVDTFISFEARMPVKIARITQAEEVLSGHMFGF